MAGRTPAQALLRLGLPMASLLLAVPLLPLVGHRSQTPALLGRYSRGYLLFLLAYAGLVAAIGLATWLAGRATPARADRIVDGIARVRGLRPLRLLVLIAPWLAIWGGIDALQEYAPGRSALLQLPLLGLALWTNVILLTAGRARGAALQAIARLGLVLAGLLVALAAAEIYLRRTPDQIPDAARPRLAGGGMFLRRDMVFERPVRVGFRPQPHQDRSVVYRRSSGDLYREQPGSLPPLDPRDDAALATVRFVSDENGYPNPSPLRDQYDIVTAGDSFTAPVVVSTPWPRVLERLLGRSVLNLSVASYGPQQEAAAVREYGLPRHPRWVLLAYFEGNDLIIDAPTYEYRRASGLSWVETDLAEAGPYRRSVALQSLSGALFNPFPAVDAGAPRFPLTLALGDRQLPIAFFDAYLSALTATRADIEASVNFGYVRDTLVDLARASAAAGAQLVVVYIPSKEHLYSSLIADPELMRRSLAGVRSVVRCADNVLREGQAQATPEQVAAHRDDQRDAIAELARRHGIALLDLTPDLLAAAAGGSELYYPADTHWNQRGADLAGAAVARYLSAPDGPGS